MLTSINEALDFVDEKIIRDKPFNEVNFLIKKCQISYSIKHLAQLLYQSRVLFHQLFYYLTIAYKGNFTKFRVEY